MSESIQPGAQDLARPSGSAFLKGDPFAGEIAVITREQIEEADYNLSPSRWVAQTDTGVRRSIRDIVSDMLSLDEQAREIDASLSKMLVRL
jgi:type I restriction enzyme M protein